MNIRQKSFYDYDRHDKNEIYFRIICNLIRNSLKLLKDFRDFAMS